MEFSVLNSKKFSLNGNIDLLSNIVVVDYDNIIIDDMILVDEQTEMSLDMIAFAKYGSENYVDVLVKFNRLSNPLTIISGMIIAVPNLNSFEQHTKVINLKPIQLQLKKSLFNEFTSTTQPNKNAPSVKTNTSSPNFRKDVNGNIIF